MPWGSFWHFPAEAWRLREAWPEGTSSITDCKLLPEVCPDQPLQISPYCHSEAPCSELPRHCSFIIIPHCQPFWNAPSPLVTMRATSTTKKVSTSISQRDDFFPPALWVGRGMPWKSTQSRHVWVGSQRNIWALRWTEALNVESLALHCSSFSNRVCGLLGQVISKNIVDK